MRFRALLLLALAAGVHAGPIGFEDSTCSTTCVPTAKFGYEAGRTYRFDYETETVTLMAGASEESSGLHIRTTADVTVLSSCELVLTLRDATLEELDPRDASSRQASQNNAEFKAALEKSTLRFSFQDGRVEELCASADDPTWVVNFKRGILSAFQNSMENFDEDAIVSETDISGECEADYSISRNGLDTIVLTKSKDLLACTKRTDYFTSLQATTYKVASSVQSLPLLKSSHTCQQTLSTSGVLQRSECQETHVFRPFSNRDSGAKTTVTQSLVFQSEVRIRVMSEPVTSRSSLIFEHEDRQTTGSTNKNEIRTIMEEICASSDIRPQTPALFSKLVYAMRRMDVNSLNGLHRMVEAQKFCAQNSEMARKFFHDAIPAVGTAASVALIRQLTQNSEVTGTEAGVWMTSLAFIQEPNADMIREAKAMVLSGENTAAYLPVSSLVHTFCKSTECEGNQDVQDILESLNQNLGYNCKLAINQKAKVIMSIKAIGNIGNTKTVAGTLARCAANTDIDMETRVSAMQAFHRLPCDEENTENMLKILRDMDEDSEVRIAAYLGVMKCPTATLLDQIKTILASEEVNQVGSFIWTHLTNLMETSDPLKQQIKAIIDDDVLSKEFNMDQRKFSRNYEGSIFWESLNAGAGYESNLIWSPASFLPRSAMLNLTVDMFGKSVNLLEVGGRMEGIEQYLEKFFGPQGYFPDSVVSDVIKQKLNQVENKIRPGMLSTPQASAYLKMFGDELKYVDLMGLDFNKDDFNILDILIKLAQNHEVDITKSMNFLDTEMTVATIAGLPLKLAVNGTATVDMKIGGKMDLRKTGTWPSSMDINGYVRPSGAVTFSSTMGVDAFMARTGLKMVTTLHSSTEMNGFITVEDSKIMNVKFNVPKEKVEILNVQSNFYIMHRDEEREQKMLTDNMLEKDWCSCDNFGKVTGLKVCGGLSLPLSQKSDAPYFPFTGPINAYVTLDMVDTHGSYDFEARFESKRERKSSGVAITDVARIAFDTPGSKIDRRFLAEYTLDRMDRKMGVSLRTPWKEATIDGSITNTRALKNANLKVVIDGSQVYAVVTELTVNNQDDAMIIVPTATVTVPGMEDMRMIGKVKYVSGDKMEMDFSLNNVFSEPVTLTGEIDKTNANRYSTSLAFASPFLTSSVSGFTVIKDALVSSRTAFKYAYNGGDEHQFTLNTKVKDSSSGNTIRFSVNTAIQTSQFPDYNMQLEMDFEQNQKHHESNLEFSYGDNPKDLTKKITWKQVANVQGTRKNLNFDHNLDLKWLAMGVDYSSKISHTHNLYTDLNTQAVITYTPGKSVNFDTSLQRESLDPLKGKADIQLSFPGREMRLFSSIDETNDSVFSHEVLAQWQTGRKIRTVTTYTIEGLDHQLRTELYSPSGAMTVLTGKGTVKIDDLKAKLDMTHSGKSYSTSLEYKYDLKPRGIEMSGKYDLTIPQRHVALEGELSASEKLYSGSVSTMWDADRDASKKASLNGRLLMNGDSYEGMMKAAYLGKEISLVGNQEISGNAIVHHSELTLPSGKSIVVDLDGSKTGTSVEGKLKMSTPFFNEISINANAKTARQEVSGHFDIDYGKTISADISVTPKAGWKNMEGSITLHTPFRAVERLTIAGSHDLINPLKTAQLEVSRNSNTFTLNGNLLLTDEKKEGMAEMNMNGKTAKVTFTNDLTENELDHKSNVIWNGNTIANAEFKAGIRPTATWMHSKVTTSWTPDFEMNADIKKDRQELSSHIDVTCVKTVSVDGSLKMISGWENIESSLAIHTPFQGYERIILTGNHDIEGNEKSIMWSVAKNADNVQLSGNAKMDGINMDANLELTTPCEKLQSIAIRGTGSYDGTNMNSHIELEKMSQKVELDVNGKLDGTEVDANVQVKTPFTEPIACRLSGSANSQAPTMHAEVEWQSKKVEVDVNGKVNGKLVEASVELKTPYTQPIAGHVSGSTDIREPSMHMEVEWESKKVEIDLSGKNKGGYNTRDIEASFGLKTPYTSDVSMTASYQINGNQYSSNGMVQWGAKKASVDFTMTHEMTSSKFNNQGRLTIVTPLQSASASWDQDFEGWNSIVSKNGIEWSGKKMELDLTHKMAFTPYEHELNTEVSLETPFAAVRSANALVSYLWSRSTLKADASVKHNNREYASLSALFNTGRKLAGNASFKSVIPYAEDLSVELEMQQSNSQVEVKWAPGKSMVLKNEYNVGLEDMNTVTTLTTPFRPLEKLVVRTVYGVKDRQTEAGVTVEYAPSKIVDVKAGFGMNNGLTTTFMLTAPCPYFRTLKLSTDNVINGEQIKHHSDFNFLMDGSEVTYTGELTINGVSDITGTASLTTPFTAVRSQRLSLEHHFEQAEYVSKVTYQLNRQNVDIETHFMNTASQFKLSADCKTSFPMVPSASISINHLGRGSTCNGQIQLNSQIAREPITLSANYDINGYNAITGDLALKTNFAGIENVGGKVSHVRNGDMFTTTAEAQMNSNNKITLTNEFSMRDGVHLATTLVSPFRAFKGASINIDHSGDQSAFDTKTKLSAQIRKGALDFTGNAKWSNGDFDGLLELTTPFRSADRFAVTLKNDFENSRVMTVKTDCLVEYPGNRIQVTRNVVAADDDVSEVVTFTSQFRGYENIKYENNLKHPSPPEYMYDMTVTYAPQKKVSAEVKVNTDERSGSLTIDTPFTRFSHLYVEAGHLGPITNFNSNLKGEITINRVSHSVGGNIDFKYTPTSLITNMKLESSFDSFREADFSINHMTKSNRNFVTTMAVNIPGYQVSANSNLNLASLTDFSGELSIDGPRRVEVNFNHRGDYRAFTNHMDCTIDGTTVGTYDGSLTTTLPIVAKFEVKSDRYNVLYRAELDARGQPTDMVTNFDVRFSPETDAVIHVGANWKLESGLKADLEVSAPWVIKDVKISINHEGSYNFNHKTEATYGKKTMTLTGNLNTSPNVEGQMELRTPFAALRTLTADLKFSGNLRKFFTSFNFEHNSANRATVQVSFDSTNTLGGSINVESSFITGFSIESRNVISLPEISSTVNIKYKSISIDLDAAFTPTEGHFKLQTPWRYVEDVAVTFTHNGPWSNFENHAEIKYSGKTQFTTVVKFQLDRTLEGSIDITTPFNEVRTVSAEFSHQFTDRILRTSGSLKINDESVSASINFNRNPLDGTVKVNFPHHEAVFTLKHTGDLSAFENAATFEYSSFTFGKLEYSGKWNSNANDGVFTLKANDWDCSLTFLHEGDIQQFRNSASLTISGEQVAAYNGDFKTSPRIEGQFSINTNRPEIQLEFSHDSSRTSFALNNKIWKRIDCSGNLQIGSSIEGELKLSTPFEYMKTLDLTVKHEQPMNTLIELEHNSIGKFRYTGELRQTASQVIGAFAITSTNKWLKNIQLTVNKDDTKVDVDFTHNMVGNVQCTCSLQTEPSMLAAFQLKTPFEVLKNVALNLKVEPSNGGYNVEVGFDHNMIGAMQVSCKMQAEPYLMAALEVQTPYTILKTLALNMKAEPINGGYNVELEFDHNIVGSMRLSSKVQKRSSMEGTPVLSANLAITTPFAAMRNLELDFMHEFTLSGFHTNLIVNPNDFGKVQFDFGMEMLPKFTSKLEIATPWQYMETLSLAIQAEGSFTAFKSRVEFNHNILGNAVYEEEFEPWKGSVSFQSPWPYFKDLQLNFDHSITNGQLRSETEMKINGRTFKLTASGQTEPFDVTVSMQLPTTTGEIHVTFDGVLSNFRSGFELSKDNRQLVKTGMKLDLTSGISVELQVTSPFTKSLDLVYTHTGTMKQFTCNGNVKVDGRQVFSGDLSVDARPSEIEINIGTSLKNLRSLRVLASFIGEFNNFRSVIDVTHNGVNYKTDVTFSLTPTNGNLQLETTFPLMQKLDVSFDYNGDLSNFQSTVQASYNNKGNYKAEVTFQANPIAGSVTLTTPLKGLQNVNAAFTHSGNSDQMQDHVEITVGSKKYALDSTFNRNPFEIEATVTTPNSQYKEIGLKFNQKGNMKTVYNAHGEVTYNPGKKLELDINYKFYSDLSLDVELKTPFKDMALAVTHRYQGEDIISQADFTYGNRKVFTGTVTLNVGSTLSGKLQLTTALPGFEDLSVEFSHQMSEESLSSSINANLFGTRMSASLEYVNGNGKLQITTPIRGYKEMVAEIQQQVTNGFPTFKINVNMFGTPMSVSLEHMNGSGKLQMTTPIRGYEEISAEIRNQMTSGMLTSDIKGSINGREISIAATGRYQGLSDMQATVEVRTPFANMGYIKVHAQQTGDLDNMKTEFAIVLPNEHAIEGTFTLETTRGIRANLKTNIRGFEDVAITFDHVSNGRSITTLAQIQYAANQAVTLKIDVSMGYQSLDGTITFTSPFSMFESLAAEIHHKLSSSDLESKFLLSWADGKDIVANVMYRSDNGLPVSGSATLTAPFMTQKSVEFSNTIQGSSIESTGRMTWSPSKTIELTMKASYSGDRTNLNAMASLDLKTPFPLIREINVAAEHEHSSSKVDNAVTMDYNRKRVLDSKVSMNKRTGTVTITGPFNVLMNYNNRRNGGSFNMQQPFEVDTSFTRNDDGLAITVQKPFAMEATYKHDANGGTVSMDGPVEVDGSYTISRQGGSLNLRKPFQVDMLLNYYGNGGSFQMENPFKVNTALNLNRDSGSFVMTHPYEADASYTYNRNGGSFNMQNPLPVDASYSMTRNGGSVSVKQPYPVEGSYKYTGDSGSLTVVQPFPVEASYQYTGNAGSVNIDKPYQVHGAFEMTPTSASVELTKPYAIDASYNVDQTGGSVSMQNPIRVDAGYTVNSDGHSLNINSPIKINAEYKWFGNGGSFVMVNPVSIDIEGKVTPNDGFVKMTNPYPIDTSYTFNWNSGSVKMMQPYPIDVNYEITPTKGSFVMQQPYPVDVTYLWTTKNGFLRMDKPLQMETSYELTRTSWNNLDGSVMVNWNKAVSSSNVKVSIMHKDDSSRSALVKQGSIRAELPTRTVGMVLGGELSATTLKQSTELTWDEARNRKVSYVIDAKMPSQSTMDVTASLITPIRSLEAMVKQSGSANTITTEATVSWDVSRDRSKSLTVKNVLEKKNTYTHSSVSTISCPAFTRDIVVTNEVTLGDGHVYYACNHELEYSNNPDDKLTIRSRVADDGNHYYGNHNYTVEVSVSHPSSTVDLTLLGHAGLTDMAASTGLNVEYMTVDRTMVNTNMRAEIQKLQDSFKIELDTPIKTVEVNGARRVASGVYTYSVDAQDETNKVDASLNVDSRQNSFDAVAHLNPRNPAEMVSVKGSYLSATSLQLLATHGTPGADIKDIEVTVDLQDDHLLKTNIFWRPPIASDIKTAVQGAVSDINIRPVNRYLKQAQRFMVKEVSGKGNMILANLPDLTPMKTYLRTEYLSFRTDYKVMQRELNRMYWKNEFYMKTIDRAIDYTVGVIMDVAQTVYTTTRDIVIKSWQIGSEFYRMVEDYVEENFSEYIEKVQEFYVTYKPIVVATVMEVAEFTLNTVVKGSIWLMQTVQEVMDTTLDYMEEMISVADPFVRKMYAICVRVCDKLQQLVTAMNAKYNAVMQSYPVRQVARMYQTVKSTASSVNWVGPIYDAHVSLSNKVQAVTNKMAEHADWLGDKYTSAIYNVHEVVNAKVQDYIHRPASEFVKKIAMEIVEQATWAYNYLGVEDKVKAMLSSACNSAIHLVKRNTLYLLDEYLHLDLDRIVSYDPMNGDLAFQLWIPKEWPSFQTVPFTAGVHWDELWDKLKDIRENVKVVPSEINPWDYYYQYKPLSMNPIDWVPPYKALATIDGQHMTTFDGKFYEFMGTCSYILATDVISSQFTIVGNYPDRITSVFVDGKQIDMTIDGKVTIDSTKTELPIEIDSVSITRVGDVITLTSGRGFTVTMNTYSQLFTIELSGWLHNQVAGLLGTFTNEAFDDFLMATGVRTTDVDSFTGSWKLNGNCRYHANTAQVAVVDEARPSGRICKALFESKMSPFRNCFKVVDPVAYLKACVNDVEMSNDENNGICRAAASYVFRCEKSGVPLKVPRPCSHCKDTVQNQNPESADVVFIMEQKQCNAEVSSKLSQLAQLVDKALQGKGLTGNRFGLVGYGGRGVHNLPHTHTVGGNIMGTAREMSSAGDSLVFIEDGENTDTVGALKLAADYPFRAGVAKAVVVMACGPCVEQDVSMDEVVEELADKRIQVHLLVEHEFMMAAKDVAPKTNYLFGIDAESAYTKSDVSKKDLNGDAELLQQIAPPSDRCATLALNTQGSFFNLQKLKDGRVRYQKNFMDVFARRIAKTAQSQDCSRCECDDTGKTICKPCDNSIILGRPDEEPVQFYEELNEYLGSSLINA